MSRACSMYREKGIHVGFWWRCQKEYHQEGLNLGGRKILSRILEKWDRLVLTGLCWLGIESSEYGNEFPGSVKC
jgi:hypothetical protein